MCVVTLLFIIFMDIITKQAKQEKNSIEELMFADDLVLIAEDQIILQEMVSNRDQQCKKYGMRISRDKTEVMVTSREPIQFFFILSHFYVGSMCLMRRLHLGRSCASSSDNLFNVTYN